jgi:uncharacterized protein YndB with AHSA1/START domain
MKSKNIIAKAQVTINAPIHKVWDALVNPATIKKYMFGTTVTSDWKEGSKITWKGEWKGKPYEDKGEILELVPEKKLEYSHFSPLTGDPDVPENYHTVTIVTEPMGKQTFVTLTQDNNKTDEARQHSEENWNLMLKQLKALLEKSNIGMINM